MNGKILKYFIFLVLNLSLLAVPIDKNINPAAIIMNQQEQQLKQIEAQRAINRDNSYLNSRIETSKINKKEEKDSNIIKFELKKIVFSKKSEVLLEDELKEIVEKYEGKKISVNDLHTIVNNINELYYKKGYIVCKAGLPPQTISNGVVKIILFEGKTGNIKIEGNNSTKESYIQKRIKLKEGDVSNFNELNDSLLWFNGTNDIQVKIQLKAGEKVGTTDYILNVYEPIRHQLSFFSDNSGSKSSGEYRGGISYINNSLFGFRDQLSITGMKSEGSNSAFIMYGFPINKYGTKLQLTYSSNSMEIVNGELSDIEITGDSSSYGLTLNQLFFINSTTRIEGKLEWNRQNSSTDFMNMDWVDDTIQHYLAGLTITKNFSNSVLYQSHTFTRGIWENISKEVDYYSKYNLIGIYQLPHMNGNIFSIRVNAQKAFNDYLPSGDQFYIGGAYSVRGFAESYMGADSGASINLEYELPFMNGVNYFIFLDGGFVTGENAFDDNEIASTGFGLKLSFVEGFYSQITLGFPTKLEYNEQKVDAMRIHYSLSYVF